MLSSTVTESSTLERMNGATPVNYSGMLNTGAAVRMAFEAYRGSFADGDFNLDDAVTPADIDLLHAAIRYYDADFDGHDASDPDARIGHLILFDVDDNGEIESLIDYDSPNNGANAVFEGDAAYLLEVVLPSYFSVNNSVVGDSEIPTGITISIPVTSPGYLRCQNMKTATMTIRDGQKAIGTVMVISTH